MVQMVLQERRDQVGLMVLADLQEVTDQAELVVHQEHQVLTVRMVHQVLVVQAVLMVLRVRQVVLVQVEHREHQVLADLQEVTDQAELVVHQEHHQTFHFIMVMLLLTVV